MLLFSVALMGASAAAAPVTAGPTARSKSCPRTTSYYAWTPDKRVQPRKLTELPPAVGYMAVVRHINGCEAPLTVVEYRQGPRR
jgi:hypothetical protein